ncbi:thioredoxin domain-containing protein [uncultured Sneathiella sp.]|jgi:protein-disulfide isomerase|uniref:DsbA family protein n=1 Tax=uncultured Sneathiella sp. TaxID=879315 RepID=UPI002593AD5B|nr:thioredoxin domain-containing protein [uncultured Sneathiella sp.]
MNRQTVIGATALVAIAIFVLGALFYQSVGEKPSDMSSNASDTAELVRPHAPVLGPVDAPVTIVEFIDPACEACRAYYPIVKEIMTAYPDKVRVVLRYAAFHPTSEEAIRILEAARLQGRFEPVLERLLETQSRWAPHGRSADSVWTVLEGTGLDIEKARSDVNMPDIVGNMNLDAADVGAIGVNKTPTFFVNGKPLTEFGAQKLQSMVRAEVAEN